jgi:hypothetical protein
LTATLAQREEDGDGAAIRTPSTTTNTTSRTEDAEDAERISKDMMGSVEYGLSNDLDNLSASLFVYLSVCLSVGLSVCLIQLGYSR